MSDTDSTSDTAPVETAEEFLGLVAASGLVPRPKHDAVAAAVAPWRAAPGPMPEECRRALVAGTLLTEWHIRKLLKRAGRSSFFLGQFKLLQPLGQGGMGSVYLAEHVDPKGRSEGRVAIKLLPKKLQERGQYLQRFNQENWVAARLNHPNIARAWDDFGDTGADQPYHYSVMDYIEGVDLDKLVRAKGPLSAEHAAEYVQQAALGLQYAHDHGFVHRDIKPANLMVDAAGQVKILDFGLVQTDADDAQSRALRADERKKSLGTPDYISPEQAEARAVDHRSDIYSLGCTLYFLLTGHAPFDAVLGEPGGKGTRVARMEAHIHRPPPNVLDKRPNLPPKLVDLVHRMMAKAPGARPQSAQEVADELFVLLAGDQLEDFDRREEAAAAAAGGVARRSVAGGPGGTSVTGVQAAAPRSTSGTGAPDGGSPGSHRGGAAASVGPAGGRRPPAHLPAPRADTPPPSNAARSTVRMPVTSPPRPAVPQRGGAAGSSGTGDLGHRQPQRPARPAAGTDGGGRGDGRVSAAAGSWLFRTVAGLPIAGWLAVAVALIALVVGVGVWSFAGRGGPTSASATP